MVVDRSQGKGSRVGGECSVSVVSTGKDEAMEMESGSGCARQEMHLTPLNCSLRNGYSVTFYTMYISSQLFK